jgi:hypothetical protein
MKIKNTMICDNHVDIQILCAKIRPLIENIDNEDKIIQYLNEIDSTAKEAMLQGKKMEKRLKKYRDNILRLGKNLGFNIERIGR